MIRAVMRIILTVIALLLFLFPFYFSSLLHLYKLNGRIVKFSFKVGCYLWGVHVIVKGKISDKTPLLIVSNHFSYLDVFALGSVASIRFTPKSEIAHWPVIGFFCKIIRCIFIDRHKSQTLKNTKIIANVMQEGGVLSLFPEGTTNDGTGLLPFRSSLFSIAEHSAVTVQPVSLNYTMLNESPLTFENRAIVGWYDDMEFFPHLWVYLHQKSVNVEVIFHKTVSGKDFPSRKELAHYCQAIVSAGAMHVKAGVIT